MTDLKDGDIEEWRRYLCLDEADAARLVRLQPLMVAGAEGFAHAFYDHLAAFPEATAFLPGGAPTEALKATQIRYFNRVLGGVYDRAYMEDRARVGTAHHRIGLPAHWYLGAYGQYISWLMPQMAEVCPDPAELAATAAALFKVLLLDITVTMESFQAAFEADTRLYRQVFADNTEAVAVTDHCQRVLIVNQAFVDLTGYTAEAAQGLPVLALVAPGQEETMARIGAAVDTGGHFRGEVELLRQDGSPFPAWVNVAAVAGEAGEGQRLFVEFSDATDYRRAQDALAQRTEELKRSNAELEAFAYVASHDLQEPLRMVASYTQLLSRRYKGKLDADAEEFIGYAVDGATRMQTLINDLLAFSRVGTKGKPFAPTSLDTILQRVSVNLKLAIADAGAEIVADPLPTVSGDEVQLAQLFQNLIANAIKFRGEAPPRVAIRCEKGLEEWTFRFQDNGIGIAHEFFERIFIIFQRLHKRSDYPGTGIGLAICKKIVERHGGRIWVESEPGHGTCFCFTLPRPA
jgi:PAS domain S-box-containing protein